MYYKNEAELDFLKMMAYINNNVNFFGLIDARFSCIVFWLGFCALKLVLVPVREVPPLLE